MNKQMIVVDDFLPEQEAFELRYKLIEAKFKDEVSPVDGQTYTNICSDQALIPPNLGAMLGELHGHAERPSNIRVACWKLGFLGEQNFQNAFCHTDTEYGGWEAVLYFTPNVRLGGFALWTHAPTGLDALPDVNLLRVAGFETRNWNDYVQSEVMDPSHWSMNAFAGFKFNRLVTAPSNRFHSRYPALITSPFGNTPDTGRLVMMVFYNP